MLNNDDNSILTQTNPGTPMGELFRRFWLPAVLSSEVAVPDAAPVRLRILGEDLLAFRDSDNRLGIVEAYCSHRRAPLFFGRNEDCGLRCPYHGWKFDVEGACVDIPNVVLRGDIAAMRKRMSITAYLTHEAGGIVWVYMGPRDKKPDFPEFEWTNLPEGHVHASRWLQRSNFMQGVEGEIDTSHISFLHSEFDVEKSPLRRSGAAFAAKDGAPEITLKETPYGFNYGSRRVLEGRQFWRVTQWMLPMFSQIPRGTGPDFEGAGGRAWVPVDDRNTTTFSYTFRIDRPFTPEERSEIDRGQIFPPRATRGSVQLEEGHRIDTYLPLANRENDYLVDREMQRTINFTGIFGANEQDRCLQESMPSKVGGVVDRSREHLVASDVAIVTARRRLIKLARDLQNGVEPQAATVPEQFGVRAISRICDIQEYDKFVETYKNDLKVAAAVGV